MLEIWLIMLLCKSVKNNAIERGRKPGGFIALAIVLWIIPEIVGLIIGYSLELEYASFLIVWLVSVLLFLITLPSTVRRVIM